MPRKIIRQLLYIHIPSPPPIPWKNTTGKIPRNQNRSVTHFWVTTHWCRITVLQKPLFCGAFRQIKEREDNKKLWWESYELDEALLQKFWPVHNSYLYKKKILLDANKRTFWQSAARDQSRAAQRAVKTHLPHNDSSQMATFWSAAHEENSFLSELEEKHTLQPNMTMALTRNQEGTLF